MEDLSAISGRVKKKYLRQVRDVALVTEELKMNATWNATGSWKNYFQILMNCGWDKRWGLKKKQLVKIRIIENYILFE